ncbi:MAG: hypothetical protein ACLQDY_25000 [Streptosporangiaceae bacterium]
MTEKRRDPTAGLPLAASSSFPLMGEHRTDIASASGAPSPYTTPGPGLGGPGKDTRPDGPAAVVRRSRTGGAGRRPGCPVRVPGLRPGDPGGARHAIEVHHRAAEPDLDQQNGGRRVTVVSGRSRQSPLWTRRAAQRRQEQPR